MTSDDNQRAGTGWLPSAPITAQPAASPVSPSTDSRGACGFGAAQGRGQQVKILSASRSVLPWALCGVSAEQSGQEAPSSFSLRLSRQTCLSGVRRAPGHPDCPVHSSF